MIAAILMSVGMAWGQSCKDVRSVPDSIQIAWVSPVRKQVGMNNWVEAVRVQDLRAFVRKHGKDQVRMLKGLGMVRTRGGKWAAKRAYKVTIFDVESTWLCRPIEESEPGALRSGAIICEEKQQKAITGHKKGWTGCGYIEDTKTKDRSLDVFRVKWSDASSSGFCVMPLDRFLEGA